MGQKASTQGAPIGNVNIPTISKKEALPASQPQIVAPGLKRSLPTSMNLTKLGGQSGLSNPNQDGGRRKKLRKTRRHRKNRRHTRRRR